jgi:hypothetical protein
MNAISGFAGSSIVSSVVGDSVKPRLQDVRISEGLSEDSQLNMLSPPN